MSTVTVSLAELQDGSVRFDTLDEAFGPASLGIILVKDLPSKFQDLRLRALQYASYLAALPAEKLTELESFYASYLVGWSHGREILKPGVYDTFKGSYYINCAFHTDPSLAASLPDEGEPFPEYTAPSIWPHESDLPGFKATLEELCNLIIDVAALVARACDRYGEQKIEGYQKGLLERIVDTSTTTKARLLHYFPTTATNGVGNEDGHADDDWCATHLDHGCLTGLTSALFTDETDALPHPSLPLPNLKTFQTSPDPNAGLYIKSRTGEVTKVAIPSDCLAFQTGEALDKITKGAFKAVPHFVKGVRNSTGQEKIARNTLAVFTQPNLHEVLDGDKLTFREFSKEVIGRNQ